MSDTTESSSGKKNRSQKKALMKNYVLICTIFVLTVVLNAFFIRKLYMSIHIEEVTKEAKGITEYAKGRFMTYDSFDLLVDFWSQRELREPTASEIDRVVQIRNKLNQSDISPEELESMEPIDRRVYATSSYRKLASGFDLIYNTFDAKKLYCVKYSEDNVLLLFDGSSNEKNSYDLPKNDLPDNLETYESLINSPEIMSGMGKMTKVKNDDNSENLRFTLLVSNTDHYICVLIWERDWSAVAREINVGSLRISLFTSALLMAIGLIVLNMYRKYTAERLRAGIEREKSKAEIEICRKIQLSQLPEPENEFASRPEIDVSVFVQPSKEVGGDFCDCFMIGEDKIGLIIADVSDKGLPAAMFMMMAKSLIRSEMKQGSSPEEVIRKVNSQLSDRNDAGMFVTVWLAEIDLVTSECRTVNAGHENPVIRRGGNGWEMLRYPHDMPAGILNDAVYSSHTETLGDGDMIFVYTDGVTDAVNTQKERFGEDRIAQTLNTLGCTDTCSVINGLFAEIGAFSAGIEQYDDIGMVCFRYHCQKKETDKGDKAYAKHKHI